MKVEAPRYAHLLPELPRLLHQALLNQAQPADSSITVSKEAALLSALLNEQRRTYRLLQAVVWGVFGFVMGAILMRFLLVHA